MHRSVILTMILFDVSGKKGGSERNVFRRVRLKQRPIEKFKGVFSLGAAHSGSTSLVTRSLVTHHNRDHRMPDCHRPVC